MTSRDDILDNIDKLLARNIAYPDEHSRHAHVLWIAHCHLMRAWSYSARLVFVSPEPDCGKSRCLTLTKLLTPHATLLGDWTPAALYSTIEDTHSEHGTRPVLLLDELDTYFGPEAYRASEQLRRLIDIGHDRNQSVRRKIRGKSTRYEIFSALALAGKMSVYDIPDTIRSRSIIVRLQKAMADEKIERWPKGKPPLAETTPLYDALELWSEFVYQRACEYSPEIPEQLSNRAADNWEPLISVGDLAGGRWADIARVTAVAFVTAATTMATPSRGTQLLWDVRKLFDRYGSDVIFTEHLIAELKGDEFEWGERGLTPISMARLLAGYGIEPKLQRIGERVARGYRRSYFVDAWQRYPLPQPVTSVTPATGASDE